jgi:methylmalonyl-CoA mutase cobalamin-binding subunit
MGRRGVVSMQDERHRGMVGRPVGKPAVVTDFAAEVVARLVAGEPMLRGTGPGGLHAPLLARLMQVVRAGDPAPVYALRPEMRRARVSAAMLADHYIPAVARRLGQDWVDDCASFADVSIGTARLQAILRDIGSGWSADDDGARDGPAVLLLVPEGEQHTLGAMVVIGQLRRAGVSVCLRTAADTAGLRDLFAQRGFDAALISLACVERVALAAKLVKTLKDLSRNTLPVAAGGAVLLQDRDALTCLGADIVTNDLETALRSLGLTSSVTGAANRA